MHNLIYLFTYFLNFIECIFEFQKNNSTLPMSKLYRNDIKMLVLIGWVIKIDVSRFELLKYRTCIIQTSALSYKHINDLKTPAGGVNILYYVDASKCWNYFQRFFHVWNVCMYREQFILRVTWNIVTEKNKWSFFCIFIGTRS